MKVKIGYQDIFKYVVGDAACPLERKLGGSYEVMPDFIYDFQNEEIIQQEESFLFFMTNMDNLRVNIKNGNTNSRAEIIKLCKKIAEFGELEVKVEIPS